MGWPLRRPSLARGLLETMDMPSDDPKFVHRMNPDGRSDSICIRCFQTIANDEDEAKLQSVEQVHDCDRRLLERFEEKFEHGHTAYVRKKQ